MKLVTWTGNLFKVPQFSQTPPLYTHQEPWRIPLITSVSWKTGQFLFISLHTLASPDFYLSSYWKKCLQCFQPLVFRKILWKTDSTYLMGVYSSITVSLNSSSDQDKRSLCQLSTPNGGWTNEIHVGWFRLSWWGAIGYGSIPLAYLTNTALSPRMFSHTLQRLQEMPQTHT